MLWLFPVALFAVIGYLFGRKRSEEIKVILVEADFDLPRAQHLYEGHYQED